MGTSQKSIFVIQRMVIVATAHVARVATVVAKLVTTVVTAHVIVAAHLQGFALI